MGGHPTAWLEGAALLSFLFARASPPNERGCRLWRGSSKLGYGEVRYRGTLLSVHRLTYDLSNEVPLGDRVGRHTCDTPACIEPTHTIPGTHADNVRDKMERGRQPTGETHGRHKFTLAQVLAMRADLRTCREIAADYGTTKNHVQRIKSRKVWKNA